MRTDQGTHEKKASRDDLNQSALLEPTEAMRTADDGKLMRALLHTILQALVDAEATERIGAGTHEQNHKRTTQRDGSRTNGLHDLRRPECEDRQDPQR